MKTNFYFVIFLHILLKYCFTLIYLSYIAYLKLFSGVLNFDTFMIKCKYLVIGIQHNLQGHLRDPMGFGPPQFFFKYNFVD